MALTSTDLGRSTGGGFGGGGLGGGGPLGPAAASPALAGAGSVGAVGRDTPADGPAAGGDTPAVSRMATGDGSGLGGRAVPAAAPSALDEASGSGFERTSVLSSNRVPSSSMMVTLASGLGA